VTTADITMASRRGRLILLACVLSSGAVFLDGTVVNIALKRLGDDLGAGFSTLQWVIDAYLLTLCALVLVGGSLADLLGRRRVFMTGIATFALTSAMCGLAQTGTQLVIARTLQGVAGALVTPGSLSIVNAVFSQRERGRAIGTLTGLTSVAIAAGPFVGGWLVDLGANGWRLVFLVNLPISACAIAVARYAIPDMPATRKAGVRMLPQLDLPGAVLSALGLLLLIWPCIEWSKLDRVTAYGMLALGAGLLAAFCWHENRTAHPMMPLYLWKFRTFVVGNAVAFVVYGVLGAIPFLLILMLQRTYGYTAFEAGVANLPTTLLLLAFAGFTGKLITRFGGRAVVTVGCLFGALGQFLLLLSDPSRSYWTGIFPGIVAWGIGMVLLIAPLATVTLGGLPPERSGIAAGVSGSFGRISGLVAVAALPLLAGISTSSAQSTAAQVDAFHRAVVICAFTLLFAALLAFVGLPSGAGRMQRAQEIDSPDAAPEVTTIH
jgi:EmrB/QacA subfamily drug resistance transporter